MEVQGKYHRMIYLCSVQYDNDMLYTYHMMAYHIFIASFCQLAQNLFLFISLFAHDFDNAFFAHDFVSDFQSVTLA